MDTVEPIQNVVKNFLSPKREYNTNNTKKYFTISRKTMKNKS